ncbi:MAG TPA: EpsG family protein [Steroidobacteraceae bacterium]|nr:EpsG family protein [Steroidobacteraceae bacterium]
MIGGQVLLLSPRFRRIGFVVLLGVWLAAFVAAGFRSAHLDSDTESYIYYAEQARTESTVDYLSDIRLEPAWGLLVHTLSAAGASPRVNVFLCSLVTMCLLWGSLRTLGTLLGFGMLHYLGEFYLNNELAIIRHSFATALAMAIVISIDRRSAESPSAPAFLRRASLLIPPLFHVATLSVLPTAIIAGGSYRRVILQAALFSFAAWILLYAVGHTDMPAEVLAYGATGNTHEIRGFVHLGFLLALTILDAKAVRSTIELNRAIAFCYLMGLGLSFAVIGFPLLNRLRQVLLEFGILFYPLVLSRMGSEARLRTGLIAYLSFIATIAGYTVITMSDKYATGFF